MFLYFLFPLFIGSGGFCPIGNSIYFIITVESYITSTKIKPNWHVMTGSRSNRYRYNHIRASTRTDFSTKSTRYIRLLVITGLIIYDFYCTHLWFWLYAKNVGKPEWRSYLVPRCAAYWCTGSLLFFSSSSLTFIFRPGSWGLQHKQLETYSRVFSCRSGAAPRLAALAYSHDKRWTHAHQKRNTLRVYSQHITNLSTKYTPYTFKYYSTVNFKAGIFYMFFTFRCETPAEYTVKTKHPF